MHTLDYARSSQRYTEGHNPVLQGGLCSGATLIVTPKSSQYRALRNSKHVIQPLADLT